MSSEMAAPTLDKVAADLQRIARREALLQTLVFQPWLTAHKSCGTLP